jgi:cellulose synthase/poly-beta-1,6-N-acetylglucosamine synthase-like glycosyltransferase
MALDTGKKLLLSDLNLSAKEVLVEWQKIIFVVMVISGLVCISVDLDMTVYWVTIFFNVAYLFCNTYRLFTIFIGYKIKEAEAAEVEVEAHKRVSFTLTDEQLPTYTVLIALFHEEAVIPSLVKSISNLDYPKDKVQVLLILEEEDKETLEAIKALNLPKYFQTVIVPFSKPQTKAKACDYALQFATGQRICIFDAEDRPDSLQLKIAANVLATTGEEYVAVQGRLLYYNAHENLLTSMFEIEYQGLYEFTLPVATYFKFPIPLGGSSNHFRTDFLKEIGGWDPYNVTEDADLGIRLSLAGHRTKIIHSYTAEEAPISIKAWIKQRARWIKGYFHTSFIFLRYPKLLFKEFSLGGILFFLYILFIGPTLMLVAPILIIFSALIIMGYFDFPAGYNLFLILLTWVNLGYMTLHFMFTSYMVAKESGEKCLRYIWILYMLYFFFHWFAAMRAARQLYLDPHKWEKTTHGLTKVKN